jgi:hypothetical protein
MQKIISTIVESVDQSLLVFIGGFIMYIPYLVAALIIGLLGFYIGKLVYASFSSFFKVIKLDAIFDKVGLQNIFDEVGLDISISHILAWSMKFMIDFVTLLVVLSVLGFTDVVKFVTVILAIYLPKIVTIAILLVITFAVANKVKDIVLHSTLIARNFSPITARIVYLMIVGLGLVSVLNYMKVAGFIVAMIGTLLTFIFAGLALAFALAFGLGAREEARCLVRGWMGKDCDDLDCGCESELDDMYDEDLWEEDDLEDIDEADMVDDKVESDGR